MADYVLVHGGNMSVEAWNRLTVGSPVSTPDGRMGGRIWDPVIPALDSRGHKAFAPTLGDEHRDNLTANIEQICSLIIENGLRDVALAAHSFGGMVITGVASKLADRVRRLIYVDAAWPDPGQSLFDLIRSTGTDPLSFPGLEADPPYVEKLQYDPTRLKLMDKTYIFCIESDFAVVSRVAGKKATASKGWRYFELPTGHVPMASMPERLAPLLL